MTVEQRNLAFSIKRSMEREAVHRLDRNGGRAVAGIAVKSGLGISVHTLPDSNEHIAIIHARMIRDGLEACAHFKTPLRLNPGPNADIRYPDETNWKLFFESGKPHWWEDEFTQFAQRELERTWRARWDGNVLKFAGPFGIYCGEVLSIPPGLTLHATRGPICLNSLPYIPRDTVLRSGRHGILLQNCRGIGPRVEIEAPRVLWADDNKKLLWLNVSEFRKRVET